MFYSYDEFKTDVAFMAKQIKASFEPDCLLAVARGGLTLGHSLAVALENRNLFSLNSIHYDDKVKLDSIKIFNIPNLEGFEKILLVDDIIDSGETMIEIKKQLSTLYPRAKFAVATVFYKPKALFIPEFKIKEATEWVEFFWDIEL